MKLNRVLSCPQLEMTVLNLHQYQYEVRSIVLSLNDGAMGQNCEDYVLETKSR